MAKRHNHEKNTRMRIRFTPLTRADLQIGQHIVCVSRTQTLGATTLTIQQGTITNLGEKIQVRQYSRYFSETSKDTYVQKFTDTSWSMTLAGTIYLVDSDLVHFPSEVFETILGLVPQEKNELVLNEVMRQNLA